ncbi:MAG: choice-of-anchor D domain-containing protein [Myxococcota bacterium]
MSISRKLLAVLLVSSIGYACEDEKVALVDPKLEVSPTSIEVGDVVVGLAGRAEFEMKNTGSTVLKISSIAPDEALGGEFTIEGGVDAIAAGQAVTASLVFAPTSVGPRQGKLIFTTDSRTTPTVSVDVTARGVEPALVAEPPVVDFGRVVVGKTKTATVSLLNRGADPIEVVRATPDMMTSAEFGPQLMRQQLMPGARMTLTISYSPTDVGLDEGRVVIIDSSPRPESLGIRVRGNGVPSDIEIDPVQLDFTGLYVGQRQSKQFYLRNIGDQPHDITTLSFVSTGTTGAPEFELAAGVLPLHILPGGAEQVDVTYKPHDTTADMDRIQVESDGLPTTGYVTLTGQAGEEPKAEIEVTPTSLAFGPIELGMNRAMDVRITNVGTKDLTVASVVLSMGAATYTLQNTPTAGQVFHPRDSQAFQVVFAPTAVGAAPAADVAISSDDLTDPVVHVSLSGEGVSHSVPAITVRPNPVDFGHVPRGTLTSRSVTVQNDGTAPLVLSQVRLTNDAGGRFRLPMPPAASTTLAPMGQLQFSVDYLDNGVVASYTGTLEVASNDPARPTVSVPLTASTDPPPVTATDIALVLTWTSADTDVDLHLIAPGRTLFNIPGDNCYCNTNPDWGTSGQMLDNPFLDRDDLVGPGPENINLTQAETGDYTVVVHYFSDHGHGIPAPVTVQVNLHGMLAATLSHSLTNNQRWTVGTIHWNATTRTGTWSASSLPPFNSLLTTCL